MPAVATSREVASASSVAESAQHFQRESAVAGVIIGSILLAIYVVPMPWSILVVAAGLVVEVGETAFWWWLSHRRKPKVGVETLVGARATVVDSVPARGPGARRRGELWQARCEEGADPGDEVQVLEVEASPSSSRADAARA